MAIFGSILALFFGNRPNNAFSCYSWVCSSLEQQQQTSETTGATPHSRLSLCRPRHKKKSVQAKKDLSSQAQGGEALDLEKLKLRLRARWCAWKLPPAGANFASFCPKVLPIRAVICLLFGVKATNIENCVSKNRLIRSFLYFDELRSGPDLATKWWR